MNFHGKKLQDGTVEVEDENKLSMEYFIQKARKINTGPDGETDRRKKPKNRYKADDAYGSLNNEITEKFKAERAVKKDAESLVYLDISETEKILLIKEGTVIGRTYTNQEIFKMRQENPEAKDLMDKIKLNDEGIDSIAVLDTEAESPVVQGSYLRTIMRNRGGEIVENVEDYMKLNKRPSSKIIEGGDLKPIEATEEEIMLLAKVIQTVSISEEEFNAVAWIVRNRYTAGTYGDTIKDVILNGGFPYSAQPTEKAIDTAKKVLQGEVPSPIADRCDYTPPGGTVTALATPITIVENGNIFHYDTSNISPEGD